MKRFRIFEDLAPFLLVIKQSIQEKTSSEQQPFHWDPDSTLGVGAWGGSSPENQETKCEGKALEVMTALWKVEQESRCFGTVSETRRTQHRERQFTKTRFQRNVCSLGKYVKLLAEKERKGPTYVRQKQHRTGTVLALSSPFVNREA